jgi:CspA family cold shock protein
MPSEGTVREWNSDEGWGVIDSAETPGGCWVHFSAIAGGGLHGLTPGEHVTFTYEAARQDGFGYRTVLVWPPGAESGTPPQAHHDQPPSAAYQSSLTIRWLRLTLSVRSALIAADAPVSGEQGLCMSMQAHQAIGDPGYGGQIAIRCSIANSGDWWQRGHRA